MQSSDRKKFAAMVHATFELYQKQPTVAAVEMMWRVLERFTIDQVEHALKAHLNDPEAGKFPPKPADLIRHIEGNRQDRVDGGAFAWHRLLNAIGTYGTYCTVVFDDPAIHYAIAIAFGDWVRVGQMTESEQPFRRKDFIEAYAAYRPGLPYQPRMIGIADRDNGARGIDRTVVAYIGDRMRALGVEESGEGFGMKQIGESAQAIAAA